MATPPKSFAEWIAQNKNARSTLAPKSGIDVNALSKLDNGNAGKGGGGDFLSTLTDLLTRGLSANTNQVQSNINNVVEGLQGKTPKTFWDSLAQSANAVLPQSLNPAFWSTDPALHRTTSDVIEQSTDKIGGAVDPNYVNTQDNVNPWLKGIAGFAGDVALDPTTWIPGAVIGGALGKAGKALGIARKPLEDLSHLNSAVPADVAPLAEKALPAIRPPQAGKFDNLMSKEAIPQKLPGLPTDRIKALDIRTPFKPNEVVNPAALMPSKIVEASIKTRGAKALLQKLATPAVAEAAAKATTDFTKPLEQGKWLQEFVGKAPERAIIRVPMSVSRDGKVTESVVRLSSLRKDPSLLSNPEIAAHLDFLHQQYVNGFDTVAKTGKYLTPQGKVTALPKPPKMTPLNTLQAHSLMESFKQMRSTEAGAAALEQHLGVGLVDRLRRKTSPARFDQMLQEINDVLDRNVNLDVVKDNTELTQGGQEILKALGVDPAALNQTRLTRLAQPSRVRATNDAAAQAALEAANAVPKAETPAKAALDKMVNPELSQAQQQVLDEYPSVMREQFFKKHPTETKTGVKRTNENRGYGLGARQGIFNQYSQMTLRQRLTDKVFAQAKAEREAKKLFGKRRAEWVQREGMEKMRITDDLSREFGVPLYIGTDPTDLLPLSLHQLYSMLDGSGHDVMLRALWNESTLIPDTNIADAVNIAYRGGSRDEMVAAILNNVRRNTSKTGKEFTYDNKLVDNPNGLVYGFVGKIKGVTMRLPAGSTGGKLVNKIKDKKVIGAYVKFTPQVLAEQTVKAIEDAMPKIRKAIDMNYEDYKTRLATETSELTEASMTKLETLFNDQSSATADVLKAVDSAGKDIADMGEAARATQDAIDLSTTMVEGHIDPVLNAAAKAAVESARTSQRVGKEAVEAFGKSRWSKVDPARFEATKKHTNAMLNTTGDDMTAMAKLSEAERAANGDTAVQAEMALKQAIPEVDVSEEIAIRADTGLARMLDPLGKTFNPKWLNADVFEALHGFNVFSGARRRKVALELQKLGTKYGMALGATDTPVIKHAYELWRTGHASADPLVQSAIDDIQRFWGRQWVGKDALISNDFFRNSASVDAVMEEMKNVRISGDKYAFDMERAVADAAEQGIDPLSSAMRQVLEWEIDDPIDFMHRMYVATERIATKAAVAGGFVHTFSKLGHVSTEYRPGMVRLTSSGHSSYTEFLPKDIYVTKELAAQWKVFDNTASKSRTLDGEIGQWVTRNFDPLQRAWKYAITLPRPGHHIRNLIGDSSMTYVARGTRDFKRSYEDTFKMLALSKQYDGVDLNRVMEHLNVREMPKGGDVLFKGKFGDVTIQQFLEGAFRNGNFPTFNTLEDLIAVEAPSRVQKVADALTVRGGKIENKLGSISEYRDHFSRLQHLSQALHQVQKDGLPGAKNMDDVFRILSSEVRQYHPDGASLTAFEAKYMRRLIPFYTWFRGVMPTIISSTMIHPGRVTSFSKASYGIATAMGVNPESLANPFPDDQIFPSFLTDQATGPQFQLPDGRYLGFSPGIAHFDVANSLSNPIRGIAGMVSPLVRVPAELLSGGTWGTGTRIKSVPDYIDQNLPGVNYVANISGISPTGSALSLLQGKGLTPQTGTTPNGNGVTNKDLTDKVISGFNWVTGLGAVDMSRPNYISYAQIEKRNAATGG